MRKRKLTSTWRNRLLFLLPVLFIGLCLGSLVVYAALTLQEQRENQFQVGNVETKIEEAFSGTITEIPKNTPIPKEVQIENVGTIKQFVRVMILPEVRKSIEGDNQNKQSLSLKIGTDLELGEMGTDAWKADWIDGGDGYYYYKHQLDPKARTSFLFKTVKILDHLSNRYNGTAFTIKLKVEAINCAEFSYRDAWWQGNIPSTSLLKEVDDALKGKTER